jgi:hypothetical protein
VEVEGRERAGPSWAESLMPSPYCIRSWKAIGALAVCALAVAMAAAGVHVRPQCALPVTLDISIARCTVLPIDQCSGMG